VLFAGDRWACPARPLYGHRRPGETCQVCYTKHSSITVETSVADPITLMRIRIQHFTSDPDPARPLYGHCRPGETCQVFHTQHSSIADPHHFSVDPDPAFHCLMRIRIQHFTSYPDPARPLHGHRRPGETCQVFLTQHSSIADLHHFNADPDPAFHFESRSCPSSVWPPSTRRNLSGSPHTEHSSIADPHHFNADPDPAFHCNADLDPDPAFHFNADPDPDPATLQSDGNTIALVCRPSRAPF
jgi:hypothetical protein